MSKGYTPHERFSLKNHPDFSERWVQELIDKSDYRLNMAKAFGADHVINVSKTTAEERIQLVHDWTRAIDRLRKQDRTDRMFCERLYRRDLCPI